MSNFVTCLNCIDGRVQEPAIKWIKSNYDCKYVDMITEAGIDGILADESVDISQIIEKILISVKKHMSNKIFIIGHYDCAGNPVDVKQHKIDVKNSVQRIKALNLNVSVIGLWVSEKWQVEEIIDEVLVC